MEEIRVQIEVLAVEKFELQLKIQTKFSYGKWPRGAEFLRIGPIIDDLKCVEGKIDELVEVLRIIEVNKENQK